jgi:hypothetical protein
MAVKHQQNGTVVRQRVEEVLKLRVLGATRSDLMRYSQEQQWGTSERQMGRYIQMSEALLAKDYAKKRRDRDRLVGMALRRREEVYARAIESGDLSTALRAEQDRCRLLALYPKETAAPPPTFNLNIVERVISAEPKQITVTTAPEPAHAEEANGHAEPAGSDAPQSTESVP